MSLTEVLAARRVVVTVGSGGVGKTTTAAALAVHAAQQGRRVLCLTIDPARRLANSLGLDNMTTSEQLVPRELFEKQGLTCKGSLSAMMLDTKTMFDSLVHKHASTPAARDRILSNPMYQYVAGSLAGTQEYMAMEKLHEVRTEQDWDLIVLDTPPTANALDFLDAPERMIDSIDSPAMRWFMQVFEGAGSKSFGLVGRGATILLRGLARFTGMEFLQQIAEFVSGLNDMFGGFRERAESVSKALRSTEVGFVLVTSPDPLAIAEAEFFGKKLEQAQLRREAIVVNRVRPFSSVNVTSVAADSPAFAAITPAHVDSSDWYRRLTNAHESEQQLAREDRDQLARLKLSSEILIVEVPAFEQDVNDLADLQRVASYLATATPATGAAH